MLFERTLTALTSAVLMLAPCSAASHGQATDEFRKFYADFQNAVRMNDKEKVARLTRFDGFTWEESESLRQVKTKEAFLKSYEKMFTKTIKNKIATAKPVKTDEGHFFWWHKGDLEYSLYFARERDGSYSFLGLTIGPR